MGNAFSSRKAILYSRGRKSISTTSSKLIDYPKAFFLKDVLFILSSRKRTSKRQSQQGPEVSCNKIPAWKQKFHKNAVISQSILQFFHRRWPDAALGSGSGPSTLPPQVPNKRAIEVTLARVPQGICWASGDTGFLFPSTSVSLPLETNFARAPQQQQLHRERSLLSRGAPNWQI